MDWGLNFVLKVCIKLFFKNFSLYIIVNELFEF